MFSFESVVAVVRRRHRLRRRYQRYRRRQRKYTYYTLSAGSLVRILIKNCCATACVALHHITISSRLIVYNIIIHEYYIIVLFILVFIIFIKHRWPIAAFVPWIQKKKKFSLFAKGYPHADTTSSVNDDKNYYNYITISV